MPAPPSPPFSFLCWNPTKRDIFATFPKQSFPNYIAAPAAPRPCPDRVDRAQTVPCLDAAPTISHKRQQILIPPQTWSTFHNTSITSIIVWRKFRYPNIHFSKYSYLTNTKYWQNAEIKIHFPRWFFPIDFLISWNKLTKALHLSDALASLPYQQLIIANNKKLWVWLIFVFC